MHGHHNVGIIGVVFLTVNILENAARINWLARLPSNRREFSLILLQIGKGSTLQTTS